MKTTTIERNAEEIPAGRVRRAPRLRTGDGLRHLSRPGIDPAGLRNKAQADPDGFVELIRCTVEHRLALQRGEQPDPSVAAVCSERQAREFSIDSMRPDDLNALRDALDLDIIAKDPRDHARSVTTSAFPLVTSGLAIVGVTAAYESVETVGEQLVMDFDDKKKLSHYAGVLSLSKSDVVRKVETDEYTTIGAGEEKFLISHLDQGLQVVIQQELFDEGDVAGLSERFTALGEIARELIEEQTLRRVTDHDGSAASGAEPYVLHHPGNSGTPLFQTDNDPLARLPSTGNRLTNNALEDITDLEALRSRLAGMTNSRGKRISIPASERVLLVPDALLLKAWTILNSMGTPGVFNELNFFGPGGPARTGLVSTPKLDDLSTSVYYYGAPRRQFRRKWKLRPEVAAHGGTATEQYVRTRQAMRLRIGWDVEIGAVDYVYWLQSLPASTAPKDQ